MLDLPVTLEDIYRYLGFQASATLLTSLTCSGYIILIYNGFDMPRGLKNGNGNGGGNGKGRKMRGRRQMRRPRTSSAQPVVQGVGQATLVPFGSRKMGGQVDALNALHPRHLALPRPIAPYVVVRNTGIFTLQQNAPSITMWGCTRTRHEPNAQGQRPWTNVCGIGNINMDDINAANNALQFQLPMGEAAGWGAGASFVPSAFTIQVMNPEALQTTDGIIYIGRMTNRALVNEIPGATWASLASTLVAYQAPRQASAAKLAFRGVQVDAIPSDMSALAEFTGTTMSSLPPGGAPMGTQFTWDGSGAGKDYEFEGFLPIFIYNPDSVGLRIQVTVEYRYRFDPFSPATSAHRYHAPAPLSVWDSTMRAMQAIGHGVKDISDVVATAGAAYQSLQGRFGPGAQVPMLVD